MKDVVLILLQIHFCTDKPPAGFGFVTVINRNLTLSLLIALFRSQRQQRSSDLFIIFRMTMRHDHALKELPEGTFHRRHNHMIRDPITAGDLLAVIVVDEPDIAIPDQRIELFCQRLLRTFCSNFLSRLRVNILNGVDRFGRRTVFCLDNGENRTSPFIIQIRILLSRNSAVADADLIFIRFEIFRNALGISKNMKLFAVIRMNKLHQSAGNLLILIDMVNRKIRSQLRVRGTYDNFIAPQVNMQHQTEHIADSGQNIAVAQRNQFQFSSVAFRTLLHEMLLIAVLSEEQYNGRIQHCQRKARPAIFLIYASAHGTGRGSICLKKQTNLLFREAFQELIFIFRVNRSFCILFKVFNIRGEERLCVHQRVFIVDDRSAF